MKLLNDRLIQLETEIEQTKQLQHSLSTRGAVWFDHISSTQTEDLCKTLEILYEKKIALEKHIKSYENEIKSQLRDIEPKQAFKSNYTVHNVNIFWNELVRNAVFKMIELQTKDFQIKYCMSNVASRVVAGLVNNSTLSNIYVTSSAQTSNHTNVQEEVEVLLKGLLNDLKMGINLVVENETSDTRDSIARMNDSANVEGFHRSSDTSSPNFVHKDHLVDLETLWKLINPQVFFEMKNQVGERECLVAAAPKMQVSVVKIMDAEIDALDDKEMTDMIFKTRTVLNITQSQFLTGVDRGINEHKWPFWVPIESLIDFRIPLLYLQRSIDQVSFTWHRDQLNPLFVSRKPDLDEGTNSFVVTCKDFTVSANNEQFSIWYDCFNKLLVYRDPDSGQRNDHLRKILLVLEQFTDLRQVQERFNTLQDRCRKYDHALNYGIMKESPAKIAKFRKEWISCRNELYVYMEALKLLRKQVEKRNSIRVSWKLIVKIGQFDWFMLNDDNEPFCKWNLTNTHFIWVNNEDQSSYNTLEIDSIYLENLMTSPPSTFREILSPLSSDRKDSEFSRQNIIRLYWRENAPVGGIPVVEHFELNIAPLLLQITYEFGKKILKYIFSTDGSKDKDETTMSPAAVSKKDEKNTRKSVGSKHKSESSRYRDIMSEIQRNDIQTQNIMMEMQMRAQESRSFIYIKVPGKYY